MTGDAILTINAGSSSIKFALFDVADVHAADAGMPRLAAGHVDSIGIAPQLIIRGADGKPLLERKWQNGAGLSHEALLEPALDWVRTHLGQATLRAAGHRIVHGGRTFDGPVILNRKNLKSLEALSPLAPLHEPHNLAAVHAVMALRKDLPQIGCFDTSFHHGLPDIATRMALPRHFHDEGIRRYGFHGLSYEFIAGRLRTIAPQLAEGRVIAAHLGNGASLCAMKAGKSVDTTMGLTALDGLMMGTRCGAIDPGAVLYLMQTHGMTADDMTHLLYERSGLLGVSGISADMQALLASDSPSAAEAVALFAARAASEIAALTTSLDGLDGLIFTAGIGEHAAPIRAAICARLTWMGVRIDPDANRNNADIISAPDCAIIVRVVPTDEEAMIARHCLELLSLEHKE